MESNKIEYDQRREQELKQHLNCRVFRIKDRDWLENKETVIEQFKNILMELSLCLVK